MSYSLASYFEIYTSTYLNTYWNTRHIEPLFVVSNGSTSSQGMNRLALLPLDEESRKAYFAVDNLAKNTKENLVIKDITIFCIVSRKRSTTQPCDNATIN